MSSEAVRYETSGGVGRLTMDQPASRNALTPALLNGLGDGLAKAVADHEVRAILLTNTSPAFCAGADLSAGSGPGVEPRIDLAGVLSAILDSPKPVLARIAGHCMGGGVGLAAACDLSVATDGVRFGFTEVRIGVAPAIISVVCLTKLKRADALELFLTGERISAARAVEVGLITSVVAEQELDAAVSELLAKVLAGGPGALAAAKQLVIDGPGSDRSAAFTRATRISEALFASAEAAEGMAAFPGEAQTDVGAVTLGLLHPGEMGTAIAAALVAAGQEVLWASNGRSQATSARASSAGLVDAGSVNRLVAASDVILSVCPPHAALDVAAAVAAEAASAKAAWHYIDANAISPATSRQISAIVEGAGARFIDGGIVGGPPREPGTTRLYLSGPDALDISPILAISVLEIHVISETPGEASALKLSYAAWTKASAALVLVAREAAARSGVESALLAEWRTSQPGLIERSEMARRSAGEKGWRWSGEMEEIASMLDALGLPTGFHLAAAEVFRGAVGPAAR